MKQAHLDPKKKSQLSHSLHYASYLESKADTTSFLEKEISRNTKRDKSSLSPFKNSRDEREGAALLRMGPSQ